MLVYYLFADPQKKASVIEKDICDPQRYLLYGLGELPDEQIKTESNLANYTKNRPSFNFVTKVMNRLINLILPAGEWFEIFLNIKRLRNSNLIFTTSDRVGIPACVLRHIGLIKTPILYLSIGLVERLSRINRFQRNYIIKSVAKSSKIVCFGYDEFNKLEILFPGKVQFITLGMKTVPEVENVSRNNSFYDIISVGADPNRDYRLLIKYAHERQDLTFKIITDNTTLEKLANEHTDRNITISGPTSFEQVIEEMRKSKIVVLPLKDNSYSGATTTLLLSLAIGRPTVVAKTGAITSGYNLTDSVNVVFYTPEDYTDFRSKIELLIKNTDECLRISAGGQKLVKEHLNWPGFLSRMIEIIRETSN